MNTQPEALRLATLFQTSGWTPTQQEFLEAAAELRRLHEVNKMLVVALKQMLDEPNNTMSDGKALKEIIRIARGALDKTKEQA